MNKKGILNKNKEMKQELNKGGRTGWNLILKIEQKKMKKLKMKK